MMSVRYTEISQEEEGQRLDNYLIRILKGVPKSHVYRLIRSGEVRLNKKRAKPDSRLCSGDSVRIPPVRMSAEKEIFVGSRLSQRLCDSIIHEDKDLLVINKPTGIAVHGGSGVNLGVIEAFRKTRTDLTYLELIHRLDRETSGCLLLAKKRSVLRAIQALFATREVNKAYWAILEHQWQGKKTVKVDVALLKNTLRSGERIVVVHPDGKSSQTMFKLLDNYEKSCLVQASPQTGRTHQIRVHSAHLGHPILGDEKYGGDTAISFLEAKNQRLYLHARSIQFTLNDKEYFFQADLDDCFSQLIKKLSLRRGLPHG